MILLPLFPRVRWIGVSYHANLKAFCYILFKEIFFETGSHVDCFAHAYYVAKHDLELLIFLLLLLVPSAGIVGKGLSPPLTL